MLNCRPSWIYKNGRNFATILLIDVMFVSEVGFSGSPDLMVQQRPSWIHKSGHNFATGLPIYVMFDNINRKQEFTYRL